ncbi:hypothetical protein BSLG_001282 [Batrachochytrium salamandrivorans]|nr:hypothetical protein BSLG_001282 [Batrachochytrium salamandrivorans]
MSKAASSEVDSSIAKATEFLPGRSILVAVRIHRNNQSDKTLPIDLSSLQRLVVQAATYSDQIAIAYPQSDRLLADALASAFACITANAGSNESSMPLDKKVDFGVDHAPVAKVALVPVSTWGNFIPALNALLLYAIQGQFTHILYQSAEVNTCASEISAMMSSFDKGMPSTVDTLVVGKAFPGHAFEEGMRRLDGVTVPWNTLAIWSVPKLQRTGFLMVAEGSQDMEGGVEEVSVIAVLQRLFSPSQEKAVLMSLQSDGHSSWNTIW